MRLRLPTAANPVQDLANGVRDAPEFEFLAHLHSTTTLLRHLGLMPKLIALYDWLNDTLAYTLTLEDVSAAVSTLFAKHA